MLIEAIVSRGLAAVLIQSPDAGQPAGQPASQPVGHPILRYRRPPYYSVIEQKPKAFETWDVCKLKLFMTSLVVNFQTAKPGPGYRRIPRAALCCQRYW